MMTIHKFILLFIAVLMVTTYSLADTISVSARGSYVQKSLEIQENELVDLEVHLMSAGDPVGGFEVALYRDSDAERIQTLISDDHGVVVFKKLGADIYTIILLRSDKMRAESTLAIGDFLIKAYKENKTPIVDMLTHKNKEKGK